MGTRLLLEKDVGGGIVGGQGLDDLASRFVKHVMETNEHLEVVGPIGVGIFKDSSVFMLFIC